MDTRVIYCGDNLEKLKQFPDACVDLIYIDPPFNSRGIVANRVALTACPPVRGSQGTLAATIEALSVLRR